MVASDSDERAIRDPVMCQYCEQTAGQQYLETLLNSDDASTVDD